MDEQSPLGANAVKYALIEFQAITLQDQRIRGGADAQLMSVVHFVVQHPNGRKCPGCAATVRHRFRGAAKGAVDVMVAPPEECAQYVTMLKPQVEHYYRERVGVDGTTIRLGSRGASPWLIGLRRSAPATVPLAVGRSIPSME
jgi:hypothetical protein